MLLRFGRLMARSDCGQAEAVVRQTLAGVRISSRPVWNWQQTRVRCWLNGSGEGAGVQSRS